MAKYKIGATDGGDAGINLGWVDKLDKVDGAVLITKEVTPMFIEHVIQNKDKIIVHATMTGYGHSKLEPGVPTVSVQRRMVNRLVEEGFPMDKVVIRVDPIIPTRGGIDVAMKVIRLMAKDGFGRFRISLIDMYPHVRERLAELTNGRSKSLYRGGFSPSTKQCKAVDNAIKGFLDEGHDVDIESCAEPGLKNTVQCGCISARDLELLGLHDPDADDIGYQRRDCMCYSGKVELLNNRVPCEHRCQYCFWKGKIGT